jgi:amino acid adenylation domain-containing protein
VEKVIAEQHETARLAELPAAPPLPIKVDPASLCEPRSVRRETRIPAAQWQKIAADAREHGTTADSVLVAAFAEILAFWSGQNKLSLGVSAKRFLLVPFVRQENWLATLRRFEKEMRLSGENAPPSNETPVPVVFSTGEAADLPAGLWLTCRAAPDKQEKGDFRVIWDAIDELFPAGMTDAMVGAYQRLLAWLGDPKSDWRSQIPDLLPAGQRAIRTKVNSTAATLPSRLLHEGFFAHAAAHPERLALCWGENGKLTYGELAESALRIANYLQRQNVQAGEAVCVCLPRGPQQITATLGILAAGGVYVPIGTDQPAARRARIQASAGARIVLDDVTEALKMPPLAAPVAVSGDSLAYVIYTSGSTGEPKGVEMQHQATYNTIADLNERFQVGPNDRVLAVSSLAFDLSVYDIFGLLSAGGAVVLIGEEDQREAYNWVELCFRWSVTIWDSVPALLDMFLIAAQSQCLALPLRLAFASGDWIGLDLPARVAAAAPGCRFIAMGGATEAAIWSNSLEVSAVPAHWRSIPYGYPLRNQKFRVVDPSGRDCPEWTPGELWIGGVGVARGYRGDAELTARRFVEVAGERWYRTGDLGRYLADGMLEFLGREDQQVKIGGHRIELGEIEAALESDPAVSRAVAAKAQGRSRGISAWIVARKGQVPDEGQLRKRLADRLPSYMVPDTIFTVESLPLSANGKVDRGALAKLLVTETARGAETAAAHPLEAEIAALWSEVLGVANIGRSEKFFTLGGDSLTAMRILEALRSRFKMSISMRQLFAAPTVAELAAFVAKHSKRK